MNLKAVPVNIPPGRHFVCITRRKLNNLKQLQNCQPYFGNKANSRPVHFLFKPFDVKNQLAKSVNSAGEKAIKSVTFMLSLMRIRAMSKINEKVKSAKPRN